MRLSIKQQHSITRLVESCFQNNRVIESQTKLIIQNLKNLPHGQSIATISLFIKYLRTRLEKNTILIESPIKLSNAEIRDIVSAVAKDHTVYQIQTQVDPSLITGIRVKIGDTILEDSFLTRTQQLAQTINGWLINYTRTRFK